MPTVDRIDGLRVVIYPNDHRPAHIHIIGAGHEAILMLRCRAGTVELRENYGFSRSEITRIKAALRTRVAALCDEWRKIHGRP